MPPSPPKVEEPEISEIKKDVVKDTIPLSSEKKSTVKIPSLSALKTKITTQLKAENSNTKKNGSSKDHKEPFNRKDLDKVWQAYLENRKEAGKDQEVMVLKDPYELDDIKVTLKLSNDVLKITFDIIKSDLQGYLREKLKNSKIVIEAVVEEIANEDMIYTNKEKFEHLAKKHPALKELQEKLGLDPDY